MADDMNVAAEIAALRGEMSTGFATIKGQLTLLVQQGTDARKDLDDLEDRVSALEARRWPTALIAAMSGVASVAVATGALFLGR